MTAFDVSAKVRPSGQVLLSLPVEIGRALGERGYDRCRIELMEDGILLRPYKSLGGSVSREPVTLPEWDS